MLSQKVGSIVLQPTSLCNLDCRYCYLSSRQINLKMSREIPRQVAEMIRRQKSVESQVEIIWHGGEPLASGIKYFRELLAPFDELTHEGVVTHNVQTNATLITPEWCDLFLEYQFSVGVSLDGPPDANALRVDWAGKPSYDRIIRGIEFLKSSGISVGVIAVVGEHNLTQAKALYDFFNKLKIGWLGINIEELEGVNLQRDAVNEEKVAQFWRDLFNAWREHPDVVVREINRALSYAKFVLDGKSQEWKTTRKIDPFPTIAWNGDVFFLSPELTSSASEKYGDFKAGNMLERPLEELILNASQNLYVADFLNGVSRCKVECPYFKFCYGGQASNKFVETGSTDATETRFCRNSYQRSLDAVVQEI